MGFGNWWSNQSTTSKTIYVLLSAGVLVGVAWMAFGGEKTKKNTLKDNKNKEEEEDGGIAEEVPLTNLPNNGEKCGELIQTFDKDFDYVKCDGAWHIKSKASPLSDHAKNLYKEWMPIKEPVLIDRLNRRYP